MMLYEVNLKIKKEAGEAFLKWLPGHMERVLKAEGFSKASLFHEEKNEEESDDLKLTVFYKVKNREDLESYFKGYALEMREEGLSAFPGQFEASRRIHTLIEELS